MAVTPLAATNSSIVTGGTAVVVFPANISGGFITNPPTATEYLYIDAVGTASVGGTGTTFALAPGETWNVIPGQTTVTTANAASGSHAFSAVYWL